jgi:hypothetical protein
MKSIRIYDKKRRISQKVSAIPICRLEWDSQDPPLFPGLIRMAEAKARKGLKFKVDAFFD